MRVTLAGLLCGITVLAAAGSAGTLTLDASRAVELALENNHALRQAAARVEEAAAGKAASFGAFLPQVSATGSYTRLGTVSEFSMVGPRYGRFPLQVYDSDGNLIGYTDSTAQVIGMDTLELALGGADNFVIRGTAQQSLFTWGKLLNAWRIAGLGLDIEQQGLRLARQQVRSRAVEGFYQALLGQEMVGLMRQSYAQLERHIGQVQALYDNGLATGLDLRRARVGLSNLGSRLARVESGAELALAGLRNVTGIPPDTPLALEGDIEYQPSRVTLDDALASARAERPELNQLRAALRIADYGVRIARTANLPTLFAQFNYDYKNPVGFSRGWGTDWSFTAGASVPIFTGGTNLNRLRQARARERQARVLLDMTEEALALEIRALHTRLEQERRNIELQAENMELAREALEMAERAYENGLITNLEYLDTQLALTRSRKEHLGSLANHRIARAELFRAMGVDPDSDAAGSPAGED